ncbi:MAG TPA: DEAD/DEAH box helicase [Thermoanaerobaculia bacterium]|jgi:DEAD/DEAH box helicase domain-containing protein|nr:DEAD/DEAH box helicase [Thermoanaerobaculia bacterium]
MTRNATDLLEELQADPKLGKQLVHSTHLPASPSVFRELDPALPEPLARALAGNGVPRLWSHQAEGIAAVRRGENVLVTTPTASGKSLIFQVPALEEAARGGPGHGLFLFPLKALGQDQRGKFVKLAEEAGLPPEIAGCEIYDGDTPAAKRTAIRRNFPRVVVSNPDMLHLGVLGHWTGWGPFLADLRWIVLDELHTYRGIFGSHFHHVLQRFLRLCRSVGSDPVVIASSATAANASEFAETLTGRRFHWISESGAPREGRHLLLFRPEASPYTLALNLFMRFVKAGLKTIVFTKARRITELLYSWLRREDPELASRVAGYRAGFLPEERRKIERSLFNGTLEGVISTSALEMGIDVGGLDACILVGYPGSMMATWQRSGRVGRAGRESITAMVALPDALDQYFLDHPDELVGRPCERLIVDPENDPVSRAHLVCAAAEMPLCRQDDLSYMGRHEARLGQLLNQGHLFEAVDTGDLYCLRRRPQRHVNLRGTGQTYAILDEGRDGAMIGTVDGVRVLHECHPGAIYLHAGRQYEVLKLEREERRVRVQAVEVEWYTSPLTEKETEILEVLKERTDGPLRAWLGRLKVTERVVGYERKRIHGQETIDQTPLDLPPVEYETVGLWWAAPREIEETLRRAGQHFMGSLHASEHASISLFPLLALCDRGDIGGISYSFQPQVGSGAVFIYDGHPGGVGIAARGFEDLPDLLARVRTLIEACPCETGCPSCTHSPKCGNGNRPLDKAGAAHSIRLLLGLNDPVIPWGAPQPLDLRALVGKPPEETGPSSQEDFLEPGLEGEDFSLSTSIGVGERGNGIKLPAFLTTSPQHTILFDLETLRGASEVGGWTNIHRMGLALGVLCHLEDGHFEVFHEGQIRDLIESLRRATLVIGFNSRRFDYRVLSGYTGEDYNRLLPTLDLLEDITRRIGFRVGMGHLAQETLGLGKSADGLQSLRWVREGRMDLVEQYCKKDVEILRDLYLHGRRERCLFYRDRQRDVRLKLPVEW